MTQGNSFWLGQGRGPSAGSAPPQLCYAHRSSESWPQVLQQLAYSSHPQPPVWVTLQAPHGGGWPSFLSFPCEHAGTPGTFLLCHLEAQEDFRPYILTLFSVECCYFSTSVARWVGTGCLRTRVSGFTNTDTRQPVK